VDMYRKQKPHISPIKVGSIRAARGTLILGMVVALGWSGWVLHAGPLSASPSPMNGLVQPTRPNTAPTPGSAPDGMVWIPGGEFSMGAADPFDEETNDVGMLATRDSRPIHRVYVNGFWMDKTGVTNTQFATK